MRQRLKYASAGHRDRIRGAVRVPEESPAPSWPLSQPRKWKGFFPLSASGVIDSG